MTFRALLSATFGFGSSAWHRVPAAGLLCMVSMAVGADARPVGLPPGQHPCEFSAWSQDEDPKGLNVRAEPSLQAPVLGTLPPPYRFAGATEVASDPGYRTEFQVKGYRDGWLLIEGAQPPGTGYEDTLPANLPKPYPGRGWVAASKVGAQLANGGTRSGGLFAAPNAGSPWTPAKDGLGGALGVGSSPRRILACSGNWAQVESFDGVRGWWRGLCSNQVTNCS